MFWRNIFSADSVQCAQVMEMLEQGEPCVILDVREADEYEAGHIPGSVWIPLVELQERMGELPKTEQIFAICHSGGRSAVATRMLNGHGYNVKNVQGGMKQWRGDVTR